MVTATAENQRQPHTFVSVFNFVLLQKLKRKAFEGLSLSTSEGAAVYHEKKPISLCFLNWEITAAAATTTVALDISCGLGDDTVAHKAGGHHWGGDGRPGKVMWL